MLAPPSHHPWICCQIGAREHYAVARCLLAADSLRRLITDVWSRPGSLPAMLPKKFAKVQQRYHGDIPDDLVRSSNAPSLAFEVGLKIQRAGCWEGTMARNQWFQRRALADLAKEEASRLPADEPPVLFAYSYAAGDLFRFAKDHGWTTVLGQIDPGPVEEDLVAQEHEAHPALVSSWSRSPQIYWDKWQEECDLADRIVVNSDWSRTALQQSGVSSDKIEIVPLAYEAPSEAAGFERIYPSQFTKERPLRLLFLGQVILRKGLAAVLEAAKLLADDPVEFHMVGGLGVDAAALPDCENIRWIGSVPRMKVHDYYRSSDLFLFPTLSDGFGLTQLEAQAWKLPLLTSRYCAQVVKHGVNGLLLPEVSGKAIADAAQGCLANPEQLRHFSRQSSAPDQSSLKAVSQALLATVSPCSV